MPSLDSKLGDLGLCYGRHDEKNNYFDIQFIVNGNLKAIIQTEGWRKYVACIPDLVTEVIQATTVE